MAAAVSLTYTEGARPDLSKGETHELFYQVRNVEDIMQRMEVHPEDAETIEAKAVYDYLCDKVLVDQVEDDLITLSFHQALTLAAKRVPGTTKLPSKRSLLRQLRLNPPKSDTMLAWFTRSLITKKVRSESGVLVVTVLTSPYPQLEGEGEGEEASSGKKPFSCAFDCHYCPNQPGQPRSYLRDEPAVLRANQNGFDAVLQFTDRCATLFENGHEIDKIEVLILGGTWSSYPMRYREVFVRDLYFAANTFMRPLIAVDDASSSIAGGRNRARLSLEEEMLLNETSQNRCRIIGLTVETRPDCITNAELRHFRRIGCTRVQLGLQHTDNAVLKRVNRGHTVEQAMHGIGLLKKSGFKVDAHLMPNLPGSSPDMDRAMLRRMGEDPDLAVDQIKVYPTAIVPYTRIEKWYREGKYVPYPLTDLLEVLIEFKRTVPPWIRLNRVVRDIPDTYQDVCGVPEHTHLPTNWRNMLQEEMKRRGVKCTCIRCRECQGNAHSSSSKQAPELLVRQYAASGRGKEYFISFENDEYIFGFCRLRTPGGQDDDEEEMAFPELHNAALVRELHVYGPLVPSGAVKTNARQAQHGGFGKRMLLECERIVLEEINSLGGGRGRGQACTKLCVISGVGVREFYKSQGWYELAGEGKFLAKDLSCVEVSASSPPRSVVLSTAAMVAALATAVLVLGAVALTQRRSQQEV